jgi:hypothetical protein
MTEFAAEIAALRAAGYHVMRQGTRDNHRKKLALLEHENRWLREEKDHHEEWLAGILAESQRLQRRFNLITGALAVSGVEWSVIAELLGDETSVTPPAQCDHLYPPANRDGTCPSCGKPRVAPGSADAS